MSGSTTTCLTAKTLWALLAICCLVAPAMAEEAKEDAEKPKAADTARASTEMKLSPHDRVVKALHMQLDALDAKEHTLGELLQLFAKLTGENFVLDPTLPEAVGKTKVTVRAKSGGSVLDAFAVALALTGLRYAVIDATVFVSTEGKLADRLLNDQGTRAPAGLATARQPLSAGEAVVKSQPFDAYQDDFIGARDFIAHDPWRHWELPRVNPKTGLTDYPGPPIWQEDPDVGHPRFRYTTFPMYLKPEYQELERERAQRMALEEQRIRAERSETKRLLAEVLKMLKDNPELSAKEIMQKLEE